MFAPGQGSRVGVEYVGLEEVQWVADQLMRIPGENPNVPERIPAEMLDAVEEMKCPRIGKKEGGRYEEGQNQGFSDPPMGHHISHSSTDIHALQSSFPSLGPPNRALAALSFRIEEAMLHLLSIAGFAQPILAVVADPKIL